MLRSIAFLVTKCLLLRILLSCGLADGKKSPAASSLTALKGSCFARTRESGITAYFINQDEHKERKQHMESSLEKANIAYKRVAAIYPNSSEYNIQMLEQPCKRNTPTDISVILSHLKAIYTAVHHPIESPSVKGKPPLSDYALILEDDVRILYDVDFRALIDKAPRKFGILQLVTTNPDAVDSLWYDFNTAHCDGNSSVYNMSTRTKPLAPAELQQACVDYPTIASNYKPKPVAKKKKAGWNEQDDYVPPPPVFELTPARVHDLTASKLWKPRKWDDLTRNGRSTLYWSSQAYIINKRVAWKFLVDIMEVNNVPAGFSKGVGFNASSTNNTLGFKIVNSFVGHACQRRPERPCILGSCLYSYSYLYSAAQPAYVSQIPLFTGAKIGLESTLHPDQFSAYKNAFSKIKAITNEMRGGKKALLPEYISPPHQQCM